MTNQEIDRIIFRIERRTLLRSLAAFPINVSALIVFCALAVFALAAGELVVALLIAVVIGGLVSLWAGMATQRHNRTKTMRFWNYVRAHGLADEIPTDNAKLLIDKIAAIQTATAGGELLPMRQAVKLVAAYEHQSRQLQTMNARLDTLNAAHQNVGQKIKQLQELGESHAAGLRNLEQTRADFNALKPLAQEVQASCNRLEAITDEVRKSAKTRQLQHELDSLSAPATAPDVSRFELDDAAEIERQIGREIETYLRLERETEEHLN